MSTKMTDGTDAPQEKEHAVRLLGSSPDDIFAAAGFKEILSPMVEPEDVADHQIIEALLQELGPLSSRTTTNHKLAVLMSSFLLQSIRLEGRRDRTGSPMVLGFPHSKGYWSRRSRVGYKVATAFREALVAKGWVTWAEKATINLHEGSGNCNGYLVADFVPSKADNFALQTTDLIYAVSTSAQESKLISNNEDSRMRSLWDFWRQHPLTYGSIKMFTASRKFNNLQLTRGGRIYGAWTTMKPEERLKCTIDGKPVAEVDVSGMNLTLLASISGEIPFSTRFKDAYACDWEDRGQVKAIINETIGAGTIKHYRIGNLAKGAGLSQEQFTHIRKTVIAPKFKCLKILKKGKMDSLTLAFHESEIMLRVAERLTTPIYILHDCLICQQQEALEVGKELQFEYIRYCQEQGWTPLAPAFSIERLGKDKYYASGYRTQLSNIT